MYPHIHFQYQIHTEPVSTQAETVTEDRWHQPWSEPKRFKPLALMAASGWYGTLGADTAEAIFEDKWHFAWSEPIVKQKIGLRAGSQQTLAFQPTPIISIGWFGNLSEPVRTKPRLREALQKAHTEGLIQPVFLDWFGWLSEPKRFKRALTAADQPFFSYQPRPIIDIGWFQGFSEPKRFKPRLRPGLEPSLALEGTPRVSFGWFNWLSDPKRFKLGLNPDKQRDLSRGEFVPTTSTAVLDATERGDFFKAVLYQFNIPTHAYVDIIEKNPHHRGNLGIIENVAQSSIVASIVEPDPTSTAGSAVPIVASARVAIILT